MNARRRKVTPEQRDELLRVRGAIVRAASAVVSLHSGWDMVDEVDALLAGKPARVGVAEVLDYVSGLPRTVGT